MSVTTHRATLENGPSIVGGTLVWTSATGITTADPNSFGGCLRKWYYDQVEDRKAPATRAMMGGTALHTEIEDHLCTGASLTSPLALAGRMFVPHPGNSLFIEHAVHFATASGVEIYGHVDLYNHRQQYLDVDGVLQNDAPWTFEVKDWKTTSDFQYAKSARELSENIQLVTYAEAGFHMWPDFEHARLTHVYFRTRGRPGSKLVTIRRTRDEIALRWNYAESVIRTMSDAAREPTADTVTPNTKSCGAYGGCPHRGICSAYGRSSLDATYGRIANEYLQENQTVGLLNSNPQIFQMPPSPAVDVRAQLAAEETVMRAQQAQQQTQMPQAQQALAAQLVGVCQRLTAYGYGFPSLGGDAAQAYAAIGGQNVPSGFTFQGLFAPAGSRRSLHTIVLNEVAHIFQLESELAAERAKEVPAPAPPTFVPTVQAPIATQVYGGILPPGAPESMPQLAAQRPAPELFRDLSAQTVTVGLADFIPQTVAEPKKPRGRPKKDAAPEATQAAEQTAAVTLPAATSAIETQRSETILTDARPNCVVIINARANAGTTSLANYVDHINAKLSKMYSVTEDGRPGIQDVRCVPKTSPLAFGAWKGAVREVVKAEPPEAGNYHLDTGMDELNEVVADALRVVAEQKGWLYIRAVRL